MNLAWACYNRKKNLKHDVYCVLQDYLGDIIYEYLVYIFDEVIKCVLNRKTDFKTKRWFGFEIFVLFGMVLRLFCRKVSSL